MDLVRYRFREPQACTSGTDSTLSLLAWQTHMAAEHWHAATYRWSVTMPLIGGLFSKGGLYLPTAVPR